MWTLDAPIGGGENGDVWRVSSPSHAPHAIKLFTSISADSYEHFRAAVLSLDIGHPVDGVIPIHQRNLPRSKYGTVPWLVMPLATALTEYVLTSRHVDIARDFSDLADTVVRLADNGISRGTIKPSNILHLDGRLCLSDIGLPQYPRKSQITPARRSRGSASTPPEMRRLAAQVDSIEADVYSLGKALWCALTRTREAFDGPYDPRASHALVHYMQGVETSILDRLLIECTDPAPQNRPHASAFSARLREWSAPIHDFPATCLQEWNELIHALFPFGHPACVEWRNADVICSVLDQVGKTGLLNFLIYPSGGGVRFVSARRAGESGMISLQMTDGGVVVLKPKKLTLELSNDDAAWSYFRVELSHVPPAIPELAMCDGAQREYLSELAPGIYAPRGRYSGFVTDAQEIEPVVTGRRVCRLLSGTCVLFSMRSPYGRAPSSERRYHEQMSESAFRAFVSRQTVSKPPRS